MTATPVDQAVADRMLALSGVEHIADRPPLKACAVCGVRTERPWCSAAHHRLDEPSAYMDDGGEL